MARDTLSVERFPPGLHRKIKVTAALRGITLKAAIIEALQDWLEGQSGEAAE